MVGKKVGVFTLAFGLITIGVLLFAGNFINLPIRNLYKYWPILLISLGLEILVYILVYKVRDEKEAITIDGFVIAFIIMIAIFSGLYGGVKSFTIKGIGDIPYIKEQKLPFELDEIVVRSGISEQFHIIELKITNNFGDIEIKKVSSKDISFEAKIHVRYSDEAAARKYIKEAIQVTEGEVTNISILDAPFHVEQKYSDAMVDFIIYIPEGIDVDVRNSFGNLQVEGAGEVEVTNSNGDIVIKNCTKASQIKASFGDIHIVGLSGDTNIINSNGNIKVKNVEGSVKANTSFGNVVINDIKGDVKAVSSNGNIEVYEITGNIECSTSFGNVRVDRGSLENARIRVNTNFGKITGFEEFVNIEGMDINKNIEAVLGDGRREVSLKTNNGDIEVR